MYCIKAGGKHERKNIDWKKLNSSNIADEVVELYISENKHIWREFLQLSWKEYFCYMCGRYDDDQIDSCLKNIIEKTSSGIEKRQLFHYCRKYADVLVARMDELQETTGMTIRDLMNAAGMEEFSEEEYRVYHSWSRIHREAEFARLYGG